MAYSSFRFCFGFIWLSRVGQGIFVVVAHKFFESDVHKRKWANDRFIKWLLILSRLCSPISVFCIIKNFDIISQRCFFLNKFWTADFFSFCVSGIADYLLNSIANFFFKLTFEFIETQKKLSIFSLISIRYFEMYVKKTRFQLPKWMMELNIEIKKYESKKKMIMIIIIIRN